MAREEAFRPPGYWLKQGSTSCTLEKYKAMKTRLPVGILGATGMVGQRYIQLLENHPWFEVDLDCGQRPVEWQAVWRGRQMASGHSAAGADRQDGGVAAEPEGAPKIVFASVDAAIARELEPKFAAAGCAVISNSSAFRMAPNVPLVIPEVNADHLHLIEEQPWRKASGGYIVTNPNCSTIGLVMALKPIEERFGIETIFVSTMQAVSGAGYPGVASMDILDNVVPFIGSEEEKMEAETLKLLGSLKGQTIAPLPARVTAHCNRVPVVDGHTECVSINWARSWAGKRRARTSWRRGRSSIRWPGWICRSRLRRRWSGAR